jgi:hypothetical protein
MQKNFRVLAVSALGLLLGVLLAAHFWMDESEVAQVKELSNGDVGPIYSANNDPTVDKAVDGAQASGKTISGVAEELRTLSSKEKSVLRDGCSGNSLASPSRVEKILSSNEITSAQLSALDTYQEKCGPWLSGLSTGEFSDEQFEDTEDVVTKFKKLSVISSSPDNVHNARELMSSTDIEIALSAATVLLTFDPEFQQLVASSVGSQSGIYARSAGEYVAPLLLCKAEGNCNSDSFVMLNMCISNEAACGLDVMDFLTKTQSSSYVNDITTMADFVFEALTGLNPP